MYRSSISPALHQRLSLRRCATAGVLALAFVSAAQASSLNPGGPPLPEGRRMAAQAPIAASGLDAYKLLNSYVSAGAGGTLFAGQYTWLESRSINCSNTAGCHIGHDSTVQLSTTANWAICLSVDGNYTSCQLQGNLPDTGSWVVGHAKGWSDWVPQGLHTVMTEVYTEVPSVLGRWQTDHRLYKP